MVKKMVVFKCTFGVELMGIIGRLDVLDAAKGIERLLLFGLINWVDGATFLERK